MMTVALECLIWVTAIVDFTGSTVWPLLLSLVFFGSLSFFGSRGCAMMWTCPPCGSERGTGSCFQRVVSAHDNRLVSECTPWLPLSLGCTGGRDEPTFSAGPPSIPHSCAT